MKKKLMKRIVSDIDCRLFYLFIRRLLKRNQSLEKGLLDSNVALRLATVSRLSSDCARRTDG